MGFDESQGQVGEALDGRGQKACCRDETGAFCSGLHPPCFQRFHIDAPGLSVDRDTAQHLETAGRSKQKIAGIFAVRRIDRISATRHQFIDLSMQFGVGKSRDAQRLLLDTPGAFVALVRLGLQRESRCLLLGAPGLFEAFGGIGAGLLLRLSAQTFPFGAFASARLEFLAPFGGTLEAQSRFACLPERPSMQSETADTEERESCSEQTRSALSPHDTAQSQEQKQDRSQRHALRPEQEPPREAPVSLRGERPFLHAGLPLLTRFNGS